MAGVFELKHKNKTILCLDISNLMVQDKPEINKHVECAKEKIQSHPPKSVLVLTNVTMTRFDREISGIITDYAKHNTPYVKASAIVGLLGLQRVILQAVKTFTGRDFYLATTIDEALEWLVKQ